MGKMRANKIFLFSILILVLCFSLFAQACDGNGAIPTISLNKETLELQRFETFDLIGEVTNSNDTVKWSSSKEQFATVDSNGRVTGISAGVAVITASVGIASASCTVTVVNNVNIPTLVLGETEITLTIESEPYEISAKCMFKMQEVSAEFTFSSSAPAVAEVSAAGVITPKAFGSAVITVNMDYLGYTDSADITVEVIPDLFISLSETSVSLVPQLAPQSSRIISKQITATVELEGSAISSPVILWSSDDDSVAEVTAGLITAKSKGTAKVTATYIHDENVTVSAFITVTVELDTIAVAKGDLTVALDKTHDYGETVQSEVIPFTLGSFTEFDKDDIVEITTLNGTVVGDKDGIVKAAVPDGKDELLFVVDKIAYRITVNVYTGVLSKATELFDSKTGNGANLTRASAGSFQGKDDAYSFTVGSVTATWYCRAEILENLPDRDVYGYVIFDIWLAQERGLLFYIGDPYYTFNYNDATQSGNIKLYNQKGEATKLLKEQWITVVMDLDGIALDYYRPAVCLDGASTGNAFYISELKYVAQDSFMKAVNPLEFSLSHSTVLLNSADDNNKTKAITATVNFRGENDLTPAIQWSSSNPSSATVDQNGTITAIGEGAAVISAAYTTSVGKVVTKTVSVTVIARPLEVLDAVITVDKTWDFDAQTPVDYVVFAKPAEIIGEIERIDDNNGNRISKESNALHITKTLGLGEHTILVYTENKVYSLTLKVVAGYITQAANMTPRTPANLTITNEGTKFGKTDVYGMTVTASNGIWNAGTNSVREGLDNTNSDYILVDIYLDGTVVNIGGYDALLDAAPWLEDWWYGIDGTHSDYVRIYDANGLQCGLRANEWLTLVFDLTIKRSINAVSFGPNTGAGAKVFYYSNTLRYMREDVFLKVVDPAELTLSPASLVLTVGGEETVTASVSVNGRAVLAPAILWTSLSPAIATVNQNGRVTALAQGSATITAAYTTAGGRTLTRTVAVTVSSKTLEELDITVAADKTWDFDSQTPVDYMIFSQPAEIIGEIERIEDESGNVLSMEGNALHLPKTLNKGERTIFVHTENKIYSLTLKVVSGYITQAANMAARIPANLTVTNEGEKFGKADVFSMTVLASSGVWNAGTLQISAGLDSTNSDYILIDIYFDGTAVNIGGYDTSDYDIWSYKVSGEHSDYLRIYDASGSPCGLKANEWLTLVFDLSLKREIDAISFGPDTGAGAKAFYYSNTIRYVCEDIFLKLIDPAEFSLSHGTLLLNATQGEEETVTASVKLNGVSVPTPAILWSSSNSTVASVNQSGKITALAQGSATITAVYTTPAGKALTKTVAVTVITNSLEVLEIVVTVDKAWDFDAQTTVDYMIFNQPVEIIGEIEKIENESGNLLSMEGDPLWLPKTLSVGEHSILVHTADKVYSLTLKVEQNYTKVNNNVIVTSIPRLEMAYNVTIGARDNVASMKLKGGSGPYECGSDGVAVESSVDYVLIDFWFDTVYGIAGYIDDWKETHVWYLNPGEDPTRPMGNLIRLYDSKGNKCQLKTGEWLTLAINLKSLGETFFSLGHAGSTVDGTFYYDNVRYVSEDVFLNIVEPLEFTLSHSTLLLNASESESATVTAAVKLNGVPVSTPAIEWTSSDSLIASVDQTGEITAVAQGTATITASYTTPTGKVVTKTVTVTVTANSVEVLSVVVTVDKAWDFDAQTPVDYMVFSQPVEITGTIEKIEDESGNLLSMTDYPLRLPKTLSSGEQTILVHTSDKIYSLTLKVILGYTKMANSTISQRPTAAPATVSNKGEIGGRGNVYGITTPSNASGFYNSGTKEFTVNADSAYVLIDIWVDNIFSIAANHDYILYGADGNVSQLKTGMWLTMAIDLNSPEPSHICFFGSDDWNAVNTIYFDNIRYVSEKVFLKIVDPLEFSISHSTLQLNATASESETVTATVKLNGVPVSTPAIVWASSNSLIASVDASGVITAVAQGTTTITATYTTPAGKPVTKTVTVTVITDSLEVLEIVATVDKTWDFDAQTTVDYMIFSQPVEITGTIEKIEDGSGNLLSMEGDPLWLPKTLSVGEQTIFVYTASKVYSLTLKVVQGYAEVPNSAVKAWIHHLTVENIGAKGGRDDVYGMTLVSDSGPYNCGSDEVAVESGFDYVLVDFWFDTVYSLGGFIDEWTDNNTWYLDADSDPSGSLGALISLYDSYGSKSQLKTGEWLTLVINLKDYGTTFFTLGHGGYTPGTIYFDNIRCVSETVFDGMGFNAAP